MGRSSLAASAMQRFLEKKDRDRPSAFTASVFVEPLLTRARILSYSATAPGIEKVRQGPEDGGAPRVGAAGVGAAGAGAARAGAAGCRGCC